MLQEFSVLDEWVTVFWWAMSGGMQYLVAVASLLGMYAILWVQWAPTGIFGAHLIWVGIWLMHTDEYEDLGEYCDAMGTEMRQQCLHGCGWLAPVPDF